MDTKFRILDQHRKGSTWSGDVVGKRYHFPRKYRKLLDQPGLRFIYNEPKKRGKWVFYGCGRIGKITPDPNNPDHFFAELLEYEPFVNLVSAGDSVGTPRETKPYYNVQNAVRRVSPQLFQALCMEGGVDVVRGTEHSQVLVPSLFLAHKIYSKERKPAAGKKRATHSVFTSDQFDEREERLRDLGEKAQLMALRAERQRVQAAGHGSQVLLVEDVSDEPARGYDILSAEPTGQPRHIEVKAARRSGEEVSFIVSANEWEQSRELPNYWFYLVFNVESSAPDILMVPAQSVSSDCLFPLNFRATFCASRFITSEAAKQA